ncbi:Uncharacterized protein FWK35_00032850, partial [Aphis craccivora]
MASIIHIANLTKQRRLKKEFQILERSSINEIPDSCLVEKTISPTKDFYHNIICTQDHDADSNSISIPLTQNSWMVNFNVPQNASNALLKILKNDANLNCLPVDSRTLLQSGSKKVFNVREIESNGIYYHFGLET